MTQILIFVLIIIAVAAILIVLGLYFRRNPDQNNDSAYLDENGDHIYYERSIIEKKKFIKENPEAKGKVRTFKALFKKDSKKQFS